MKSNLANVTIILFFITLFEDQVSHCNVSRPLVTMREILATRNMQFQTLSYMHSIAKTKKNKKKQLPPYCFLGSWPLLLIKKSHGI